MFSLRYSEQQPRETSSHISGSHVYGSLLMVTSELLRTPLLYYITRDRPHRVNNCDSSIPLPASDIDDRLMLRGLHMHVSPEGVAGSLDCALPIRLDFPLSNPSATKLFRKIRLCISPPMIVDRTASWCYVRSLWRRLPALPALPRTGETLGDANPSSHGLKESSSAMSNRDETSSLLRYCYLD